jgi:hypothetical protein
MVEDWRDHRVVPGYSITSPTYEAKTRTLNSFHKGRGAGDCGSIGEWKWSGWFFRLTHMWVKADCDGEPFEWENRQSWQVFPKKRK